jgi:glycine/D-amino acid oxidase-like deaminating enzyme
MDDRIRYIFIMQNRNENIAVIGGGILGMTTALALLDAGHRVTIFDPDEALQAASWGNAGHIAVEQVEPIASPATLASCRAICSTGTARSPAMAGGGGMVALWHGAGPRGAACRLCQGRAALTSLVSGAMQAWVDLVERLGAPDLLIREGHYIVWDRPKARARHGRWQAMQAQRPAFVLSPRRRRGADPPDRSPPAGACAPWTAARSPVTPVARRPQARDPAGGWRLDRRGSLASADSAAFAISPGMAPSAMW